MNGNKDLGLSTITVTWSMQSPGLTPKAWRVIEFPERQEDLAASRVEALLRWPERTISILHQAFDNRLSRTEGWDLGSIAEASQPAGVRAAEVFRRGVAHSLAPLVQIEGEYNIKFSAAPHPLDDVERDGPRIIDANVQAQWKLPLRSEDRVFDLNESRKNLESVAQIYDALKGSTGVVTIIGGGILADTAAFAAALAQRAFRLVPTTLLAAIDACVGGKTGINFEPHGKNQLGLFAFPREVIVHKSWLQTLSSREIKAGLAEAYKHALISGDIGFADTISRIEPLPNLIDPHLHRLVKIKADIIQQDPSEAGCRAILNFGHTLAHALESISQRACPKDPILHGEALAVGMRFAVFLSLEEGYLEKESYELIQSHLLRAKFMPDRESFVRCMGNSLPGIEEILEGILQDKKNTGKMGQTEWVLLRGFGEFVHTQGIYTVPVTLENIKKSWATFIDQDDFFD